MQCHPVGLTVDGLLISRLDDLQVPGGELIPEELVEEHQRLGETVPGEEVVHLQDGLGELAAEPVDGNLRRLRLSDTTVGLPSPDQAEGVPYLVVEVTSLFTEYLIKEQVVARCRGEEHAHAHTVGTVLVHQFDGVG